MRGGKSELTQKNQNQGEGGLSYDYAMSWSTGIYETVAMVIPNAAGGGMMVDYSKKGTETYDQLVQAFRSQGMNVKQAEQQANQYMGAAFMRWTGESYGQWCVLCWRRDVLPFLPCLFRCRWRHEAVGHCLSYFLCFYELGVQF